MELMPKNRWVKPSHCESNTCVEVARHDHSKCETGGCVEIFHGDHGDLVYIRRMTYTAQEWREFITAVRAGEFDV